MNRLIVILLLGLLLPRGARAAEADPVLKDLEAAYAADRAVALRLVLARYADELEVLKKQLAAAGDSDGAARVSEERARVMPALGLPEVAEETADEFAAFEEATPAPALPRTVPQMVPQTVPGDLDALLKTLLPPVPSAGAEAVSKAVPSTGEKPMASPAQPARRLLKMSTAQLQAALDPTYGQWYWLLGREASWSLNDLPAGRYKIVLRYAADDAEGGGKISANFAGKHLEAEVPPTGTWTRKRDLVIGPFDVTEARADLILTVESLRPGVLFLMDLAAVVVLPAGKIAGK